MKVESKLNLLNWLRSLGRKEVGIPILPILPYIEALQERSLLQILYDGMSPITTATPSGYTYREVTHIPERRETGIHIGYFGPHPSDLPDFIAGIAYNLQYATLHEFLATEGELGAEPLLPSQTRRIRRIEAANSAYILKNNLQYLQMPDGNMLPDGDLLDYLPQLTGRIQTAIRTSNLEVIIIPGPEVDHPDHVAVHVATVKALFELAKEGYYRNRAHPALYVTDPEFGYGSGGEWVSQKVKTAFPEYTYLRDMKHFSLPQYIVDISSAIHTATKALFVHNTQMDGKPYAMKIPALKRIRGMQVGRQWGEALTQWIIPGITTSENIISSYLPRGSILEHTKTPIDQYRFL